MAAFKLAEANRRASSHANAESQCLADIADLRRSSEDSLKRLRSDATLRIEQVQTKAQQQIAAIEARSAAEVQIAELQAATARKEASESAESRVQAAAADAEKRIEAIAGTEQSLTLRVHHLLEQERRSEQSHAAAIETMRAQAADAYDTAQAQAAAEVARVQSELAEALQLVHTLNQRDTDIAQAERMAQSRIADVEEEAVQWKQSAEESFAATLASYRDTMEGKVVEVEHQLVLAREEAQQNAELARGKAQDLEHAERRAARKVRYTRLQRDHVDRNLECLATNTCTARQGRRRSAASEGVAATE